MHKGITKRFSRIVGSEFETIERMMSNAHRENMICVESQRGGLATLTDIIKNRLESVENDGINQSNMQ